MTAVERLVASTSHRGVVVRVYGQRPVVNERVHERKPGVSVTTSEPAEITVRGNEHREHKGASERAIGPCPAQGRVTSSTNGHGSTCTVTIMRGDRATCDGIVRRREEVMVMVGRRIGAYGAARNPGRLQDDRRDPGKRGSLIRATLGGGTPGRLG